MRKSLVFLAAATALLCGMQAIAPVAALAQGSTGGTIGDDDKALSGSREAKPEPPAESHRPATHRKDEAGRGNFDGRWSFVTTGCSGAGTIGAMIRGGRFTTPISRGTVSPDGAFHATGGVGRLAFTAGGHMGNSSGSGTFHRSDGCNGNWSAQRM